MFDLEAHPFGREVRLLFGAALVLFVFTVVVGILNGTDLWDLDDTQPAQLRVLLTHVHVGTLGWITTGVFAATLLLFGREAPAGWQSSFPRIASVAAVLAIAGYSVVFLTSTGWARPIFGGVTALVILGFFVWTVARARLQPLSTPHWGLLVGLATSVTGGVLGVLWGVLIASGRDIQALPEDGEGAHPATMVVGFLYPVGMALIEWGLRPDEAERRAPRAGFVQMLLLFLAGLSLMVGVLLDVVPLIMLNLPLEVAAVVIFVVRNRRSFGRVGLDGARAPAYFSAAAVFVLVNLGMLIYLLSKYADDFEAAPEHLLLALDHVMFVGVMTNAIFGLLLLVTRRVRATVLPWADPVVFWAVNVGIAGFWVGFVADSDVPKQIFTPLLGLGILLGVVVYLVRLRASRGAARPVPDPA